MSSFQHPDTGVWVEAKWHERERTVRFDVGLAGYDEAMVEETHRWILDQFRRGGVVEEGRTGARGYFVEVRAANLVTANAVLRRVGREQVDEWFA